MGAQPKKKNETRLHWLARLFLVLAGSALIVVGVYAFVSPPTTTQFAPQCAESKCVSKVAQSSDVLSTALVGIGAVMILIGANGRQILGLKFAGTEATLAGAEKDAEAKAALALDVAADQDAGVVGGAEDVEEELAAGEGTASIITIGGAELVRVNPDQVPLRVLADIAHGGFPMRSSADVDWGARRIGKGNNPWYVRTRNGRTFKVSYGGQGKAEATVTEIDG